ncbi:septation ring formation regulator EzrA [Virgibacillus sp. W0181]|uniref:septation ring formation regulator EzrA n=1 Tax=Virgibacillus sp. W0181 TaxID=3391581 RepID=UPI003F457A26
MAYIIGVILAIIVLIIIGLILRKRVYETVDQHESWKLDIMNRNVAAEIARMKNLNLSGETKEKFEMWKDRWEYIVTKELPDVEEYLFDAEEAADRYRFRTANKILRKIEQVLHSIEKDIGQILLELEELLKTEEESRKEVEQLQPLIKDLRKTLSQNRFQYDKAEVRFDVEIDELEDELKEYYEQVASGSYSEAKEIVNQLNERINELEKELNEFPEIYRLCRHDLPAQLDDLHAGLRSMKEEGYRVEHLGFEKEINDYQSRLLDCVHALEKSGTEEVKKTLPELEERIQEMYQLLEKEALAKNYLETKIPGYQSTLSEFSNLFQGTKEEVEQLRSAYYFEDHDTEKYLTLEKMIDQLNNQLQEIKEDMDNKSLAHSELRNRLEEGFAQLEKLQEEHEQLKKRINNLRKDELEAKEKLTEMRDQIQYIHRKLTKSNIPGVPNYIWNLMESAIEKNDRVFQALEKQPLDISAVQQALSKANKAVSEAMDKTDVMLEQAYLTEQVIQYANRYRSAYPVLAGKLHESERLFRSNEYELALEQAAAAVEEIEPGALKKIEKNQEAIAQL